MQAGVCKHTKLLCNKNGIFQPIRSRKTGKPRKFLGIIVKVLNPSSSSSSILNLQVEAGPSIFSSGIPCFFSHLAYTLALLNPTITKVCTYAKRHTGK
jgi:hypothetical protein